MLKNKKKYVKNKKLDINYKLLLLDIIYIYLVFYILLLKKVLENTLD